MLKTILDFFFPKKELPPPVPEPIEISGIYICCSRLGLPKSGSREQEGKQITVRMESGEKAIYHYTDYRGASNCDWGWHIFSFLRYTNPDETNLPIAYN